MPSPVSYRASCPKHIPGHPTHRQTCRARAASSPPITATDRSERRHVIIAPQNNVPFEPLFGTKEAKYDPTKFNGSARRAPETRSSRSGTRPVNTIADTHKHQIAHGLVRRKFDAEFLWQGFHGNPGRRRCRSSSAIRAERCAARHGARRDRRLSERFLQFILMATRPTWIAAEEGEDAGADRRREGEAID